MSFKHCITAVVLSSTLAFVSPVGVEAATISNSTVTVSAGDVSISTYNSKVSSDAIAFAQVLSSRYNRLVPAEDVLRLKADLNFGFGDISLIYATAVYSDRPIDEISHYRLKNMGWGEIAKMYGVKVKDLKKGNYDVVNSARQHGVDITYIEIDENNYAANHHKHDNGKGKGHNK